MEVKGDGDGRLGLQCNVTGTLPVRLFQISGPYGRTLYFLLHPSIIYTYSSLLMFDDIIGLQNRSCVEQGDESGGNRSREGQ